jgi:hypothetical protein
MANKTKSIVEYNVAQINCFFESMGFPYAASCFRAQYCKEETITDLQIEKFIRTYFIDSNHAQYLFRKMQTVVTGYITTK